MIQENIHRHYNQNADSIEIGTPSKGGAIKIYGNFGDVDEFNKKIDYAKKVREYAQSQLGVTP